MVRNLLIFSVLSVCLFCMALFHAFKLTPALRFLPSKFAAESTLLTATPSYVPGEMAIERPSLRFSLECTGHCSQERDLSNEDFQRLVPFREDFSVEDTQSIASLGLQCSPTVFGYSQEMGEAVFPHYIYPSCDSQVVGPQATISMNHEKDTFTMECPNGNPGSYMLNPSSLHRTGQYFVHDIEWEPKQYPGHETPLEGSEFVFASCGSNFTQAQLIPKRNETAYSRAKSLMQAKGQMHKPMIVLFLTVDSFSRRHFFRKLHSTVAHLNTLNSDESGYSVFDFKLHNIIGASSTGNMVPMFGNVSWSEVDDPPERDVLGASSLWSLFQANGYVTLLGFEDCDYHFPEAIGKRLDVDHLVRNFYCAAAQKMNVKMNKNGHAQRCIGSVMSHSYLLNYTKTFSELYRDANQFIYLHIDSAHESSGQHAVTLDPDLTSFLSTYLAQVEQTHELVLFLQGDHGMRYGNWKKNIPAMQENKLPALFLIAKDSVLKRVEHSYDTLWHNTKRLVSKRDLRATLLGLMEMPYERVFPVHSEAYLARDYDLIREKVSDFRDCTGVGIRPWHCSCADIQEIPSIAYHNESDSELSGLLRAIAEEAILHINEEVNSPVKLWPGICQKLTFRDILQAYGMKLGLKLEQIQLEIGVNENHAAIFEVLSVLGTEEGNEFMKLSQQSTPLIPVAYNGFQSAIRIVSIQRKDTYKGQCEVVSRQNGLPGDLCICHNMQEVRSRFSALAEEGLD